MRLVLLTCLSLAPIARAQDPVPALRGKALGQVRDRDGKPWAGAEVVLVSRPIPQSPDVGDEDRVTATTDADGRFTAEILRGRPYSAWAWGGAGPEGRRATALAERSFVQRPIVLRETRVVRERPLRVIALDAWKAHAPFEVRVIDESESRQVRWLPVAADGRVVLPSLLAARATVDVFGMQPVRWPIARIVVDAAARDDVTLELPELRASTCLVQGAGKPCAGAEVVLRIGESMFTVGATGADGRIRLDLPERPRAKMPTVTAFAFADGFSAGHFLPVAAATSSGKPDVPAELGPEDQFANLSPGSAVRARIVGARGEPVAGARLWCNGTSSNSMTHSSRSYNAWARVVTADASGLLTVTGLPHGDGLQAHLILSERDYAALPAAWRPGLLPVVFAPLDCLADGLADRDASKEPARVDLCAMCPIELRVADANGAPAEDAEVNLGSLRGGSGQPWGPGGALADARGVLRMLVPGARRLGVQATQGLAMTIRGFETSAGRPAAGPATLALSLPKPAGITGRMLRKNGEPAAEMQVLASIASEGVGWSPGLDWQYAAEPESALADAARNALRLVVPEDKKENALLGCLLTRSVRTDAEGQFRIPMPQEKAQLRLSAGKFGTMFFVESMQLSWTGEAVRDVTFQMRFDVP